MCSNYNFCGQLEVGQDGRCGICVTRNIPGNSFEGGIVICAVCGCIEEGIHVRACGHTVCRACAAKTIGCHVEPPNPKEYGLERDCGCETKETCNVCSGAVSEWLESPRGQKWLDIWELLAVSAEEMMSSAWKCPACR